MLYQETIRLLLESIGRSDEVDFYLKKFRSDSGGCFAILCPDLNSLREGAGALAFQLEFLRRLDLVPIQFYAGPFADEMAAIFEQTEPAPRIVSCAALESPAVAVQLADSCRTASTPGILVVRDSPLSQVLPNLTPHVSRRIHFVRVRGALRLHDDAPLGYFNLRSPAAVAPDDTAVAHLAAGVAVSCGGTHVSITSPMNLLKEIFTVKGAGTVIREGSHVIRSHGLENVDKARMIALLEKSFGRPLRDPDFLKSVGFFHIDAEYRGAVLLENHASGVYLSKFAVGTDARGSGIAQELWEDVAADHPAIFWRSKAGNPIGRWYARICDGMQKAGSWIVYWRGIRESEIPAVIEYCRSKAEDFVQEALR